ncbi:MAG TPA: hypothetical protein VF661_12135 [Actinomycetales bacterium]|jgi:Flp pilus assembly protein TadG
MTPVRRRLASDDGSALIEFCVLAVLMLVPVVYLVATLGRVQAGAFATQGAAREAGRAFMTAPDESTGREQADVAAAVALEDQGFTDTRRVQVDITCEPEPCLAPGSRVVVRTALQVGLPAVPALVSRVVPTSIVVRADHVATVGRFGR